MKLWDLRAGRIIQHYEAHDGALTDLAFHPAGSFLLTSSLDGTLKAGPGTRLAAHASHATAAQAAA